MGFSSAFSHEINYNRKSNGKLDLCINRIARSLVNYSIIS